MKKRRIVLASVLKPVNDTRMLEKMGVSLAGTHDYEVFMVGYPASEAPPVLENIHYLPLPSFARLSAGRMLAPFHVWQNIRKVKPEVLIVNTHELLIVAILNRILFGTRILYDVRENYWRNILHTRAFPALLRPLLAAWVRGKEKLSALFFHGFLLAEKTYGKEMNFFSGKSVVVENKTVVPAGFTRTPHLDKIRLLFSGTLAESTGVFEAITLTEKLRRQDPAVELHIIGYSALSSTLHEIKKRIAGKEFITLTGGDVLVPHHAVLEAIASANFGLICYPPSGHTENRIPTKLYEYLACELPILLEDNTPWAARCAPYPAALTVNLSAPDIPLLIDQMKSVGFYKIKPAQVTWASEEPHFLKAIEQVFI